MSYTPTHRYAYAIACNNNSLAISQILLPFPIQLYYQAEIHPFLCEIKCSPFICHRERSEIAPVSGPGGRKSKEAVTVLTSRVWVLLKASKGRRKSLSGSGKSSWIKHLIFFFFLDLERSFVQKYTSMFLSWYVLPRVHDLKWALKSKTSFVFCAHLRQDLKPCGLMYLLLNCFQTFMIGARFGMLAVYKSTHIWRSTVRIFLGIYIMSAGKGQVTEDATCLCLLRLFWSKMWGERKPD